MPLIHSCYLAAFKAIASDKVQSWSEQDTAKLQGIAPEIIWQDQSLWGAYGEIARETFYKYYREAPIIPIRKSAKAMLRRLDEEGYHFFIVSMKTKSLMLKEIGESGVAALARGYFGTAPGLKLTREELLQQALRVINPNKEVTVVAGEAYRQAAEALGCDFIVASEEVFATLK